jgi:hypothetical protein
VPSLKTLRFNSHFFLLFDEVTLRVSFFRDLAMFSKQALTNLSASACVGASKHTNSRTNGHSIEQKLAFNQARCK